MTDEDRGYFERIDIAGEITAKAVRSMKEMTRLVCDSFDMPASIESPGVTNLHFNMNGCVGAPAMPKSGGPMSVAQYEGEEAPVQSCTIAASDDEALEIIHEWIDDQRRDEIAFKEHEGD